MPYVKEKRESLLNPGSVLVVYRHVPRQESGVPSSEAKTLLTSTQPSSTFQVRASSEGVVLVGESPPLTSPGDFQELAKTIGLASKDFVDLRSEIRQKLGG